MTKGTVYPVGAEGRASLGTVWVVPGYMENAIVQMFNREGYQAFTHREYANEAPDYIVLTGGCDINPKVYGEKNQGSMYWSDARDAYELSIWGRFKGQSAFLGICRGAQLLNVLNGGKMIQDLPSHHGGERRIVTKDFGDVYTEECHHQGMVVGSDGESLAFDPVDKNDEVIWYPKSKSFCFQAHPEYGPETAKVFFKFINWLGV